MIWVWIIIAVIVVAGLLFWVKSGNKDNGADLSADTEAPEAPAEALAEPEATEAPAEQPEQEETSSKEEDKMV